MRALEIQRHGTWAGPPSDRITLDFDDRCRRRIAMKSDGGLSFLLDLAAPPYLREGDAVVLEDGRLVEVRVKSEELAEIRGRDPWHLTTLAWHLGNRHLAAQIEADRILIRHDPVVAHMLEHQGARVTRVREPFSPEGGAYLAHHGHEH
ncbi:urease accessory protein UreE [Nordella sp. HKS 07]|uniref:urease accessory protein UreE n=1 Tax=Nordella sp. HKS 07 TaxID=2712222 RepID=UPI0013E18D11|nr:urease accessory protein UreE [Nordella sp. HKS 07]QIG49532.1 urease accessory protein UreE [Nordella sp. HKS 07]